MIAGGIGRGRRYGWLCLYVFVLMCGLVGCGGATAQHAYTAQALANLKPPEPNKDLQQNLIVQASQASLANYKDYQVGPEDLLAITIYGHDKLNRELRVSGQGEISMPLIGPVKVAGLTPGEIEKRLEELYGKDYLVNPQVNVVVKGYQHQRVAVTGAVEKPGSYEIIGPRTLLEVLAMAGGFSTKPGATAGDTLNLIRHQNAPDLAKTAKVGSMQPFAPKTETIVIDLRRLVSGQAPELNLPVKNGDVVHVPFAGTAYVLGGVRRPGNIPVKENLTVSQAVAMAGGVDPIMGTYNITIMRFDEQGKPITINTNLKDIIARSDQDIPVKDNDVVVINESRLKRSLYIIRTLLPIPSGSYSMTSL
jgi:polysaccharide export outer membrane protein